MTTDDLTAALAVRVMGWRVGPDRFLTGERHWMPRWRFQPAKRLEDAFRLLERVAPEEYAMGETHGGDVWVKLRVAGIRGESSEPSKPLALTFAIARAVGLGVSK